MKITKLILIAFTALTLAMSVEAMAKKKSVQSKNQPKVSESRESNTNKQSRMEENVRGKDRSGERQDLNQQRQEPNASRDVNSNKQYQTGENVRSQDRADERQGLNPSSAPDSSPANPNSYKGGHHK